MWTLRERVRDLILDGDRDGAKDVAWACCCMAAAAGGRDSGAEGPIVGSLCAEWNVRVRGRAERETKDLMQAIAAKVCKIA